MRSETQMKNNLRKRRIFGGVRSYRKTLWVACEGFTEQQYVKGIISVGSDWNIQILNNQKNSSPLGLLELVKRKTKDSRQNDAIAIIIDRDNWALEHIQQLFQWQEVGRKFLFLSVPQFEYWLILHKKSRKGISTQQECLSAINQLFPNYKKGKIPLEIFKKECLLNAISNAKRDCVPKFLTELPSKGTNLYALLELTLGDLCGRKNESGSDD